MKKNNQIITLLGQVKSTQHIYKISCRGGFSKMYMSKDGNEIKESYQKQAKEQWKEKITDKDVELSLVFYHKDKRVRDIDNYNKLVFDSLENIVYYNDKQIRKLYIEMYIDKNNPRVEIRVALDKHKK